jgi:hypothetical protein
MKNSDNIDLYRADFDGVVCTCDRDVSGLVVLGGWEVCAFYYEVNVDSLCCDTFGSID